MPSRLDEPATIYVSTGVLHHFRGADLGRVLARHEHPATCAFAHIDFQPSIFAPAGSWLFHHVRFRQPLARHDGVISAVRSHHAHTLRAAAESHAGGFATTMFGRWVCGTPAPRPLQTLLGIRPEMRERLVAAMGGLASRLDPWQSPTQGRAA